MIYLLCMLAGCRLLRGRYRVLALIGSLLCLLLLAMVGWKSLYALLAALWLVAKAPYDGAFPPSSPLKHAIKSRTAQRNPAHHY
jgi:hypothetical protein